MISAMPNDKWKIISFYSTILKRWQLGDQPAHRAVVGPLHDLIELGQANASNHLLMRFRRGNRAAVILNPNLGRRRFLVFGFSGHTLITCNRKPVYKSSTCFPRRRASAIGSFIFNKPSKVARTTLCGLVEPSTFVRTSCTPTACITARTAPPAITPVPSDAGLIITRPAP